MDLPTTEEIKEYVADFRDFLEEGTIPECKALIRNFVEGIEVMGDEAVLTYTIPMPNDGVTSESASVLDFVKSGPPKGTRTWAVGGPTVLLDNRETRPSVICQPGSFGGIDCHLLLRVRQHQIDSMDGLNEVDLHQVRDGRIAGSGG